MTESTIQPTYDVFHLSVTGHVAEISLARPDARNSMGEAFWRELPQVVEAVRGNADVRVVILSGEGPHFSAGIDLEFARKLFTPSNPDDGRARDLITGEIRALQAAFLQVERLPMPVIAAIHGACIGAGLELACAADIRLCTEDAFFELKEVQLAIVADLGGLQRLNRQLPQGVCRELAYTGRRFSSAEALQWNFVNRVCADAQALREAAHALAKQIASNSPLTVKHIKETLVERNSHQDEQDLRRAATLQVAYGFGKDMTRAMQAMLSGNPADYPPLELPSDISASTSRKE